VSPWVLRGLREGVVTTRWPSRPDAYAESWQGPAAILDPRPDVAPDLAALCPTGAIGSTADGSVRLDQGQCIQCGRCVAERPDVFGWSRGPGNAALSRDGLVVPQLPETEPGLAAARAALRARTAMLRRSVHLRHVDAGSDGSEEQEILALLARGLGNKEICQQLHITVQTVKNHVHSILAKLQVHRRREAVRLAYEMGLLIDPGPAEKE